MQKSNLTKKGVDMFVCALCHAPLDEFNRTVDHIFPKSRGGKLNNDNKLPVCKPCNQLKANMSIMEFKRAVSAMIYLENTSFNKKIGYLKKIRMNVDGIIEKQKTRKNDGGK